MRDATRHEVATAGVVAGRVSSADGGAVREETEPP